MGNPRKRAPVSDEMLARAIRIFNETEWWSSPKGCKIWPKSTDTGGYGIIVLREIRERRNRHFGCHRLAWEMTHGPIPEGMFICHKCDTRRCCNPDHMFIGTERDNWNDMREKRRNPRGERHPHAKLSESQVAEIKWKLAQGQTRASIGQEYGVAEGTIGNIKQGNNWKHVQAKAPTVIPVAKGGE